MKLYCPACYAERRFCRSCKTARCLCTWNRCRNCGKFVIRVTGTHLTYFSETREGSARGDFLFISRRYADRFETKSEARAMIRRHGLRKFGAWVELYAR